MILVHNRTIHSVMVQQMLDCQNGEQTEILSDTVTSLEILCWVRIIVWYHQLLFTNVTRRKFSEFFICASSHIKLACITKKEI